MEKYIKIREEMERNRDEKYQQFSSKLLPGIEPILGVRLPVLRKLAKKIVQQGIVDTYFEQATQDSFEEIMLQGMVIGYLKDSKENIWNKVEAFIPKMDNWSVCDSFCSGLKVTEKESVYVYEKLQPYFTSSKEFEVRFALVMLLNYYIEEPYIKDIFLKIKQITHEGYYVKMGIAWLLSMCFVKFPIQTKQYLKTAVIDKEIYQKTLQKIIESHQVEAEKKEEIRSMKKKLFC